MPRSPLLFAGLGVLLTGVSMCFAACAGDPPPPAAPMPADTMMVFMEETFDGHDYTGIQGGIFAGLESGTGPRLGEAGLGFNTESYALLRESAFRYPLEDPLSTFAIDVDRASYANVRRFIQGGVWPPVDAVRIEELINYFDYAYPEPGEAHPVALHTELSWAPWQPDHYLLQIGLTAKRLMEQDLPPSNLVFLLDVSGSMSPPNKLPLLKSALGLLVQELRASDRVAIVVYAGAAGVLLEPTAGDRTAVILDAIERLQAGGSTAGGAGLALAYDLARRSFRPDGNNRVILATDGDFNVGTSSDGEMIRLIEKYREDGIFLSVLGFGEGNLKDSKMEGLADHGNGNYAYVDNILEAKKILVHEFGGTLYTVAKDVKVQVEFNPALVARYRLVGYDNRLLAARDFEDDAKDAGEMGSGHTVTAFYQIVPADEPPELRALRYQMPWALPANGPTLSELAFVSVRYQAPDGGPSAVLQIPVAATPVDPSRDFRFAAAVAEFGLLLRESRFRGAASMEHVLTAARGSLGQDPHGLRSEFLQLAGAAQALMPGRDRVR